MSLRLAHRGRSTVWASESPMDATDALIDRRPVQLPPLRIPIPYQSTFLDAFNTVCLNPTVHSSSPQISRTTSTTWMTPTAPIGNLPALQLSTNVIAAPLPKATAPTRERGSERQSIYESADKRAAFNGTAG
jgi:hypothetical protein